MILKEATSGGIVYLDWSDSEMALPEEQRVAFPYGVLSTKERVALLHNTANGVGRPNGGDVCKAAVDGKGFKIKNLFTGEGIALDTVEKCLSYKTDATLSYILEMAGIAIWDRQNISEAQIKNSESPSIAAEKDTLNPTQ